MLIHRLKVSGLLSFGPTGLDLAARPVNRLSNRRQRIQTRSRIGICQTPSAESLPADPSQVGQPTFSGVAECASTI